MWRSAGGRRGLMAALLTLMPLAAWAQPAASAYLPLAPGTRSELRARNVPDAMVLEVTGRDGDSTVVRWVNPFVRATFRFRLDGSRVVLTGLDMGQGNAAMPPQTVYWDFAPEPGRQWKTPIGAGEVAARGGEVVTPAGTYRDTVEVRTIDQQGQSMYWTFARDIGLVRWGRGRDAFLLTSVSRGTAAPAPAVPRETGRPSPRRGTGPVLIGVDATPNEQTGGGRSGKLKALQIGYDAGMTLLHSAPKWNEFEKSPGKYALDGDAEAIGAFAAERGLPIALNFRIVDTNQRSIPRSYERWAFDDERMAEQLKNALRALPAAYKRQTRFLAIGNEVDPYFGAHRDEIAGYAVLMRRVIDTARREFPNAQFSVNFTFGAVGDMERYRALVDLTDFASFTYYPLNADFSMRDVSVVAGDIQRMLDAAGSRPLYIQEIGYASSPRLNSSPARQAQFYTNAFAAIRAHRTQIAGATFLFLSDFSQAVVDALGAYYRAANSDSFKAYLQTLGLFERTGTPKPAWDVFRKEAQALKSER